MILANEYCDAFEGVTSRDHAQALHDKWQDKIKHSHHETRIASVLFTDGSLAIIKRDQDHVHMRTYRPDQVSADLLKLVTIGPNG